MSFNVLVGNRGDHAKNFTFLYDYSSDAWTLSPAYDLARNSGMNGEHATTVNGKQKDVSRADLMEVGSRAVLPLRIVRSATEEVEEAVHEALREIG